MAKELYTKKEETLDAVLVKLAVAGISGVLAALPEIDRVYVYPLSNPLVQ